MISVMYVVHHIQRLEYEREGKTQRLSSIILASEISMSAYFQTFCNLLFTQKLSDHYPHPHPTLQFRKFLNPCVLIT